tara:strand:- start:133 stop:393 length:261 start_codon:yes stop_codon:yes gene_type:complete
MVAVKGPWEEKNDEDEPAFMLGAALAFVGLFCLGLLVMLALSWPLTWLWNLAGGPFGLPTLIWYEFLAGWICMIFLTKIVKKIFNR